MSKTIAEIIAEKRELAEKLRWGTPSLDEIEAAVNLEFDANRIEAAWKQEELRWAKANGELAKMLTFEKAQGGNAAAMRAAIKKAIAMIFCTVATGGTKFKPVVDVLEAALAAPPKNCDVGTAEEQEERYNSWRNADGLRAVFGKNPLEWAQMPYAPDTKKEERNDAE